MGWGTENLEVNRVRNNIVNDQRVRENVLCGRECEVRPLGINGHLYGIEDFRGKTGSVVSWARIHIQTKFISAFSKGNVQYNINIGDRPRFILE